MSKEKSQSLADKLNATGSKIAELTSKVSASTKSAISKTNDAVKTAVSNSKARADARREEKAKKTKEDFSAEGIIDDIPPMVTLPEFENERMAIVSEQNENQVMMLEHMQRLSTYLKDGIRQGWKSCSKLSKKWKKMKFLKPKMFQL